MLRDIFGAMLVPVGRADIDGGPLLCSNCAQLLVGVLQILFTSHTHALVLIWEKKRICLSFDFTNPFVSGVSLGEGSISKTWSTVLWSGPHV